MKRILHFVFLLVMASAEAQLYKMPADSEFFYVYGGTNFDEARDIKETYDGGYLLAGTTSSFGQGNTSVYLIKTDSQGNHLWSNVYGGSQNDWAYAIELTYDSGAIITGYSSSFNGSNNFNAYYLKVDRNGNLLWQKNITDDNNFTFLYGCSDMLPDSGFIMCGKTYASTNGGSDAYLIRINKDGDTLWTNHYGGIRDEVFNAVNIINNRIYAVGSNASHATDTTSDGWIAKLDLNGVILADSFYTFYPKNKKVLNGITPYRNGAFHVCGANYGADYIQAIIARYDTTLKILYYNTFGDSLNKYHCIYNHIVNFTDSEMCTIGSAIGGYGGYNMFFVGYDDTLGPGWIWSGYIRHAGGAYDDYGYSGVLNKSGNIIGIGSAQSQLSAPQYFCSDTALGGVDIFLVRYNSNLILNGSLPPNAISYCYADTLFLWQASIKSVAVDFICKLFPNPANNMMQAEINGNEGIYYFKIYSLLGEEMGKYKIQNNVIEQIDVSNYENGCYIIIIQDEESRNIAEYKFLVYH